MLGLVCLCQLAQSCKIARPLTPVCRLSSRRCPSLARAQWSSRCRLVALQRLRVALAQAVRENIARLQQQLGVHSGMAVQQQHGGSRSTLPIVEKCAGHHFHEPRAAGAFVPGTAQASAGEFPPPLLAQRTASMATLHTPDSGVSRQASCASLGSPWCLPASPHDCQTPVDGRLSYGERHPEAVFTIDYGPAWQSVLASVVRQYGAKDHHLCGQFGDVFEFVTDEVGSLRLSKLPDPTAFPLRLMKGAPSFPMSPRDLGSDLNAIETPRASEPPGSKEQPVSVQKRGGQESPGNAPETPATLEPTLKQVSQPQQETAVVQASQVEAKEQGDAAPLQTAQGSHVEAPAEQAEATQHNEPPPKLEHQLQPTTASKQDGKRLASEAASEPPAGSSDGPKSQTPKPDMYADGSYWKILSLLT